MTVIYTLGQRDIREILTSDAICGDLFTLLEGEIKHTSTHAWTVLQGCPNRGSMASKIGSALIVEMSHQFTYTINPSQNGNC